MIKIVPKIPLGPYPHPALWGQVGSVPISNKTKITKSTVPNITTPDVHFLGSSQQDYKIHSPYLSINKFLTIIQSTIISILNSKSAKHLGLKSNNPLFFRKIFM
jgi:hypothetical protein